MLSKLLLLLIPFSLLHAQVQADAANGTMAQVLQRLDALEKENHRLAEELHAVQQELASVRPVPAATETAPVEAAVEKEAPTVAERLEVVEKRVEEQAQTKVESSQKFPISLNGMLLFNAFASSRASASAPTYWLLNGPARDGATLGQSIIGLQFQGPTVPGNGKVNGSLTMDFWGAWSGRNNTGWFRIREADVAIDWKNRSLTVGQMKPLISPLQPTSLAEVATPPLAGAGNLWFWLPQARYEERLHLGSNTGINLAAAVLQTNESATDVEQPYVASFARARPAFEGRAALWHQWKGDRRVEIGAGVHTSSSHIAGLSIPSHIAAFDWSITPLKRLQWTGSFYRGQNVASLGSLGNGFKIGWDGAINAIHTDAGWTQLAIPFTSRLTFNLFGGIEADRVNRGSMRNFTYAGNLIYHLGPNVLLGVEALQSRLTYYDESPQLVNHYDLALAYVF